MSHAYDRVELDPPGALWLMVDHETRWSAGDAYRPFPVGRSTDRDFTGRLVHMISDYAGGEVRGYFLIDGDLYRRAPGPRPWPEMDVLVCRALGVPVPERMADARALATSSTVRLVVREGGGFRIDVQPIEAQPGAVQLGLGF